MKKIFYMSLGLLLLLAACGGAEPQTAEESDTAAETAEETADETMEETADESAETGDTGPGSRSGCLAQYGDQCLRTVDRRGVSGRQNRGRYVCYPRFTG